MVERDGDWDRLIQTHGYCQVEVHPEAPYSFTANCFVHDGRLHVAAMRAPRKKWTAYVADDPRVRVRFGEEIHLRRAIRVTDGAERLAIFRSKYRHWKGTEAPADLRPDDDLWVYRLPPR